jgi:hypothetical protein
VKSEDKTKDKRQSTFAKVLVDKERNKTKVLRVEAEGSGLPMSVGGTKK